jgi:hypothetical protein
VITGSSQTKLGCQGWACAALSSLRGTHAIFRITMFAVLAFVTAASPANCQERTGHNKPQEECPEGMRAPRNCNDIRQMAYKLARAKGYRMGSDNVPDVMQHRYQEGVNDCSTGNAHVACMFNGKCTENLGTLKGLRSNSAKHATTLFVGKDGTRFECDYTPGSGGIFIRRNSDTIVGDATPDPGESMDPAYNCKLNGANFSALNGGDYGGSQSSGGGIDSLSSLLLLMSLLQNQQPAQTPVGPQIIQLPSDPTPTPTPTPTTSSTGSPAETADLLKRTSESKDVPPAADVVSGANATAAWDAPRKGMFD